MSLKCGIVGLPNAGKSTIFNALTDSSQAKTGNYPFCTIEANKGQVFVPDERLKSISEIIKPQRTLPTSFEFVDIAGLVKGAHKGEGLGNQFLSHVRNVHSLLHVVRVFKDPQITHIYGEPDPLRDIELINIELLLSDLEVAEKRLQKIQKTAQSSGDKKLRQECAVLDKALSCLSKNKSLREVIWSEEDFFYLKPFHFISLKPMLYIYNIKEKDFLENCRSLRDTDPIKNRIDISCALEAEMTGWTHEKKMEVLKPLGYQDPVLSTVIQRVYEQLNLLTFFTVGENEVKAWTIPKDTLAPQAAGVIHSDFEKGFIKAEVYSYRSLLKHKSEKVLKQKGLLRVVGRDYQVQDGDVLHFLFNV